MRYYQRNFFEDGVVELSLPGEGTVLCQSGSYGTPSQLPYSRQAGSLTISAQLRNPVKKRENRDNFHKFNKKCSKQQINYCDKTNVGSVFREKMKKS